MKLSILYLDDEAACLDVFRHMFGGDYDVRTVTTADEARRALGEREFDIVISDQQMPGMRGTDFLREVAATHPDSYRMMLTGNTTLGETMHEFAARVIHGFLTKPWTEHQMRQALERAGVSQAMRGSAA
jgi:DNA-binding NtrC family response regulator